MDPLTLELWRTYGWKTAGSFNQRQVEIFFEAAQRIEEFAMEIKRRPARDWVRHYFNPVFRNGRWIRRMAKPLQGKSFVFPLRDVWMEDGFERSGHAVEHVVHELGHVLDNHLGGWLPSTFIGNGPADEMLRHVGGSPEKGRARFLPMKNYTSLVTPVEHWAPQAYASVSVSEDFAETFAKSIFEPHNVPPKRLRWMQAFIQRLD
jgi:hypothetical protein